MLLLFFKAAEVSWFLFVPEPTGAIKFEEIFTKIVIPALIITYFPDALVGRSGGLL